MNNGIHPALQIRVDEARRHAEIPPSTAPHGVAFLRLPGCTCPTCTCAAGPLTRRTAARGPGATGRARCHTACTSGTPGR